MLVGWERGRCVPASRCSTHWEMHLTRSRSEHEERGCAALKGGA